jgi:hypothetical protein
VEFYYRKLKDWNPDLNRDGIRDKRDKFPVRCRLFTDHNAYYTKLTAGTSVWPNQMADAGLPAPAWYALSPGMAGYPSFLEGGAYVVDFGDPVYPMIVQDDPAQPNPGQTGTISGTTGNYTLDFYFQIIRGNAPYFVDIDFDCPAPETFDAGTANRTTVQYDPLNMFTLTVPAGGNVAIMNVPVPSSMPNGTYTMGVRVKDDSFNQTGGALPDETVFARLWTGVVLAPPAVLIEDWESGSFSPTWTVLGARGNVSADWLITNSASPRGFVAQSGTRYARYGNAGIPFVAYGDYTRRYLLAGPITVSPATNLTLSYYTNGDCEGYWDGLQVGYGYGGSAPLDTSNGSQWNGTYNSPNNQDFIYGAYMHYGYNVSWAYGRNYNLGYTTWRFSTRTYNTGAYTQVWYRILFATDFTVNSGYGGVAIDNIKVL